MKYINKICLLLMVLLSPFYAAKAETRQESIRLCRELMEKNPPETIIYYNYGALTYNTSKSMSDLEKLYKAISGQEVMGNAKIRGLTRLRPYALMRTSVQQKTFTSGRICSIPAKIEVTIGYDRPTIYLANSLQKNTCKYKLTLRHELTHLDIGHSALFFLGQALKNEIPQAVIEIGPKVSEPTSRSNVGQKLNDLYQQKMSPLMDIFKKTLMQEQSKLDTLENYRKESDLCPR